MTLLELVRAYLQIGMAVYGTWHTGSDWTHWAPLPTFHKE